MKTKILFILHIFVGIGAIAGGLAAILNPEGPMGITTDALVKSPFSNFLLPGLILFFVIGIGNLASAIQMRFNWKYGIYINNVLSWALILWIVIQCVMLQSVVLLHIVFFLIGVIEVVISFNLLMEENLFPAKLIRKLLNLDSAHK